MQGKKRAVKLYDYIIGIDPGKHTGFAIWEVANKKFLSLETLLIHQAFVKVLEYHRTYTIKVYIEDARQRTKFGKSGPEVWQGAGSIKRDCTIWEDFLLESGIEATFAHPRNTKIKAPVFNQIIKQNISSNEHNRDAALLVYDRSY